MRNLTIKREKTVVGCAAKMKVYIEDWDNGDTVISDVSCRMIGVLKNGQEATFQIGDASARIFIIAGNFSKSFCNEFYRIPEGSEDLYLTGRNKFNLFNGNAFRINGNDSEEVTEHRKKSTKRGALVTVLSFVISFTVAFIVGFAVGKAINSAKMNSDTKSTVFSYDGMEITLTESFEKRDIEPFNVSYVSNNAAVFVLKESFDLLEGFENYTVNEYTDLVVQNNGFDSSYVYSVDGLPYFAYERETDEGTFTYYGFTYKGTDAFWLIQFAVPSDKVANYENLITNWAKSVKFAQ